MGDPSCAIGFERLSATVARTPTASATAGVMVIGSVMAIEIEAAIATGRAQWTPPTRSP